MKRVFLSTFLGLCVGAICASAVFSMGILPFTMVNLVFVLLNRAVMGFAIGASGLRLHWAWNGVVAGIAVGSIFSYFLFMNVGLAPMPVVNFFMNGVFGLLIELVTTKAFKLKAAKAC
jgi:hypothetical protein